MGGNQFGYHFKEGFKSIFSHGLMSFAAICMIVACLLIMGSFSLVAVNANHMLQDLEDQNEFLAYVDDSLSEDQAKALQSKIEAVDNVASVSFITRQQALQNFVSDKDDKDLYKDLSANVLRDRYEIHVKDIKKMQDTVDQVSKVDGIAKVRAAMEIANGFVMIRNVASALALVLVLMLVVISLFIIANTIKIATFTRREEIAIMKMCGATNWFIRWPFIFEGIFLGLFGSVVAYFLQWGVYEIVQKAIAKAGSLSIINVVPFANMSHNVLFAFLLAGFLIGASGSALAIRKFLRV